MKLLLIYQRSMRMRVAAATSRTICVHWTKTFLLGGAWLCSIVLGLRDNGVKGVQGCRRHTLSALALQDHAVDAVQIVPMQGRTCLCSRLDGTFCLRLCWHTWLPATPTAAAAAGQKPTTSKALWLNWTHDGEDEEPCVISTMLSDDQLRQSPWRAD
jgi:hypothetical protein